MNIIYLVDIIFGGIFGVFNSFVDVGVVNVDGMFLGVFLIDGNLFIEGVGVFIDFILNMFVVFGC